jgi:hypothetical protein
MYLLRIIIALVCMHVSQLPALEFAKSLPAKVGTLVDDAKASLSALALKRATENLFSAAKSGNVDDFKDALASGASLESQDEQGMSPVHWKVLAGHKLMQCIRDPLTGDNLLKIRPIAAVKLTQVGTAANSFATFGAYNNFFGAYFFHSDVQLSEINYLGRLKSTSGCSIPSQQIIKHRNCLFFLAVSTNNFSVVRKLETAWQTYEWHGQGTFKNITMHPVEEMALVANDKKVGLVDFRSSRWLFEHHGTIYDAIFGPDGKTILTACEGNIIIERNLEGREISRFTHDEPILSVLTSKDAQYVVGTTATSLVLWKNGIKVAVLPKGLVCFSPNSRYLLIAYERSVSLIDLTTMSPRQCPLALARFISFSQDSCYFATAADKTICVWTVNGEKCIELNHLYPVEKVEFNLT